ncbi:MAG: YaaR family protein [Lachnospiraceae bacterium]|nr:YaaR family protein [Lachnospiraceae bacterium]MBQ8632808.1 YaaR family protein [Lachnospiraceae bacterium]
MDNNFDVKINQMQQVNQVEAKAPAPQQTDGSFQFTLLSAIEETALAERLSGLLTDIEKEGKKIAKHMDVRDMKYYRSLIQEFMNEIVSRSHKFTRENFLDRRGRHRVYGMIKLVDENLDLLAAELLKEEKDHLFILSKIDEIRGLLLDILT